jgi:hypothetical protein
MSGLLNLGGDIEAQRLILRLVVDIACGVGGRVLVDLCDLIVGHAAKWGTDQVASLLEIERHVELVQLTVPREVVLEPAHDVRLLRLGEAGPAVVDCDRNYPVLSREVELQDHIEPLPDKFLALLPVSRLGKLRLLVRDQTNVTVCV